MKENLPKKNGQSYAMIGCLTSIVGLFIFLLIFSLFISNYFLIGILYESINVYYFSNEIMEPVINRNGNFTKAFDIRIKTMDDIILESKLVNVKLAIEFSSEFYCYNISLNSTDDPITEILYNYTNPVEDNSDYHFMVKNTVFNSTNHHALNEIIFRVMGHFLPIFETNFQKHFDIRELIIIDKDTKNYYSYCKNRGDEYIFFDEASQNDEVIERLDGILSEHPFGDLVVYNQYQQGSYLNYVKFTVLSYSFAHNLMNDTFPARSNYYIGIRMKNNTFVKMFNNQKTNMTTIVNQMKYDEKGVIHTNLHYFSQSDFLYNFYNYGFKNTVNQSLIAFKVQYEQEMNYINSKVDSYFSLLSSLSEKNELQYKEEWSREFVILSKIILKQIQFYNTTYEVYQIPKELNCKEKKNKILCEAKKNYSSFKYDMSVYSKSNNSNTTDLTLLDFYEIVKTSNGLVQKNKFDESEIVIEQDVFTQKGSMAPTKFLVYRQVINNLIAVNIEIMNIQLYSEIMEMFIQSMTKNQNTVNYILIGLSSAVFIVALSFASYEIYITSDRLKKISQLKTEFFIMEVNHQQQQQQVNSSSGRNDKRKMSMKDKDKDKDKGKKGNSEINNNEEEESKLRWTEEYIYNSKYFEENNRMILHNVYKHLSAKLEHMENLNSQCFKEKLQFLRAQYKLNEENKGQEDCDLASDIYKAIAKVPYINFKDVSYNVYYNNNTVLSEELRNLKHIIDKGINHNNIPLKKSKFITLEEMTKILYYIKNLKIKKYIEPMMITNLTSFKKKHKKNDTFSDSFSDSISESNDQT